MAIVITIGNTKGGTAKSYIASTLALGLYQRGVSVSLLDTDHSQLTSSEWVETAAPAIPVAIASEPKDVKAAIYDLSKRADVVIVDTAGSATPASFTATLLADIAIVPLQPSKTDVAALGTELQVIDVAHEATDGKKPEVFIVLSLTTTVDAYATELRKELVANLRHKIARSQIRFYKILRGAKDKFLSQLKGQYARQAESDVNALIHEVLGGKLPEIEPPTEVSIRGHAANE